MTHAYMWYESIICVTWPNSYVWRDSFARVTWLMHICDMVRFYACIWMGHITIMNEICKSCRTMWASHVAQYIYIYIYYTNEYKSSHTHEWVMSIRPFVTCPFVWHDSLMCVTGLILIWHDSLMCVTWLIQVSISQVTKHMNDSRDFTYKVNIVNRKTPRGGDFFRSTYV